MRDSKTDRDGQRGVPDRQGQHSDHPVPTSRDLLHT